MRQTDKSNRHAAAPGDVSHENYSAEQSVALFLIRNSGTWCAIDEVEEHLESMGRKLRRGSLYNIFWRVRATQYFTEYEYLSTAHFFVRFNLGSGYERLEVEARSQIMIETTFVNG